MEAIDLLLTRRSCAPRSMTGPGPDEVELDQMLRAGLRTPDHGRLAPWRVLVVEGAAQERLAGVLGRLFASDHPDASSESVALERRRATRSPLLLIVSTRLHRDHRIPEVEQLLSGGAVCQNLLNAAHAMGYVAQWVTGWPAYHDGVKAALGVPLDEHIIGWVHVGSTNAEPPERQRVEVSDVVSRWTVSIPNHQRGGWSPAS